MVWYVSKVSCWLKGDLSAKLRVEIRVSSHSIAALLLQHYPDKPPTWMPVASRGCYLELLEKLESYILLELKALHDSASKMGEFIAFSQHFVRFQKVTPELNALLKVATKAYPKLNAILLISSSISPLGFCGVHLPHHRGWILQAMPWANRIKVVAWVASAISAISCMCVQYHSSTVALV